MKLKKKKKEKRKKKEYFQDVHVNSGLLWCVNVIKEQTISAVGTPTAVVW